MATNVNKAKPILWWAMRDPRGRLLKDTIAPKKDACWESGFWIVAADQGEAWRARYWKKWDSSIRNALKLGYKFIRVEIRPLIDRARNE